MVADAGLLTFNATLFFQLFIFVVTAVFLWKLAWGPITVHMAARQAKIEGGLRAADEAEQRLSAVHAEVEKLLEEAREQAREIGSRAHKEATADAEETRSKSRKDAEAIVERARVDIGIERERAISELRAEVGTLVVAAAGRVLGQAIDPKQHQQLIADSLQQVTKN